ncbi:hypothetical protein [Pseudonocardia sp. Ae717_Ps2]|nr:hypothetical protein [Pseudonocardia sp. Ae717_Ps2]
MVRFVTAAVTVAATVALWVAGPALLLAGWWRGAATLPARRGSHQYRRRS